MRGTTLALALAAALLLAVGLFAVSLFLAATTGNPALDRFRLLVAASLARRFGPTASADKARAVMAIIANETGGAPAPQIGDQGASVGPSIGPGQVSRALAVELGLYATPPDLVPGSQEDRDNYASVAHDEATTTDWCVAAFRAKLAAAGGDVADAIRRYNGAGDAAYAYQQRALDFIAQTWGNDAAV